MTYWIIGRVPEAYHANAAYLWAELDNFSRAIKHCNKHLAIAKSDHIFRLLGYCYSQLDDLDAAVTAYRSIRFPLREPMAALSHAVVELARGNTAEAAKIVVHVSAGKGSYSDDVESKLDSLEHKLFRTMNDDMSVY